MNCNTTHYRANSSSVPGDPTNPREVQAAARQWLDDGQFVLEVQPLPDFEAAKTGADRSKLPAVGSPPALELPPLQRARLSNGIQVVLAERHAAPVVQVALMFDAGHAADPRSRPGTAKMTLEMLDEGAGSRDTLGVAQRKEELAAEIGAQSNLDTSFVMLNALKARLPESLDLLADIVRRPHFPPDELERLRAQRLAGIQQEKSQPQGIATRLYPALVYGADHPYGGTRSGNGTEASVKAMTIEDLRRFQAAWLRPDRLRILVVGDTTLAAVQPRLERAFGNWQPGPGARPEKDIATVPAPTAPRVFLVNKRDAGQTLLLGAHLAPPITDPDEVAMSLASSVFGGLFTSRLNMNLREEKHWSYSAASVIGSSRGQRPFVVYTQVQTDRTVDSLQEIVKELDRITGDKGPILPAELKQAADNLVVGLPGENETSSELASSYLTILQFGLKDSYYNDLVPLAQSVTDAQVNAAARKLIHPEQMTWVLVGDLSKIEAPVRKLKLGEVKVLDLEGNVLR